MAVETLSSSEQVPLILCFKLGRALRYHNEESFFHTYDSIKPTRGADISRFQSQLSTIKEAARQISDLNSKDYLILSKSTGSLQICTTDDEVADQLRLLIRKGHLLDDDGSDSGAVSDYYENSGLSIADSAKYNDFEYLDLPNNSSSCLHGDENHELEGIDEILLKDTFHETDSSSMSQTGTSTSDSSDAVEDTLCSLELHEESQDPFCQKRMWHSLMDIDSDSKLAGNLKDRNITNKLIKVSELEKSFFSINLDELVEPPNETSAENVKRSKELCNMAPHWKSQLHMRNGDGPDEILVKYKQRPAPITNSDQNKVLSVATDHSVTETTKTDLLIVRRGANFTEQDFTAKREKSLESVTDEVQNCSSGHQQELLQKQTEKEQPVPSPLATHSQNMWYSSKKARSKLSRRQRKNKQKKIPLHEMTESEFNHYEVGLFLLRGWEEARKELLAYQGKL